MKKNFLILFALSALVVSNSFADCSKLYEAKAQKRAVVNKNWKKVGGVTFGLVVGGGILATAPLLLIPAGGFLMYASPFVGLVGATTMIEVPTHYVMNTKDDNNNTFFKSLAVIEAAKVDQVPAALVQKLDEEIGFNSMSLNEQEQTMMDIVRVVNDANQSERLCPDRWIGGHKIFNFRKLSKFILKELNL